MEVEDLYVTLRGVTGEFNKSMDEAGVASERADSKIAGVAATASKMALGFGAVAVGVGVASVKMASSFDAAMEQIHTLAGVPQASLKQLSAGVLNLAGQVGTDPNSLAEALYHVESSFASTGISGQKAMDILQTAAKGAKIGNADLVDVTNALDAAIASGIPGVQNYSQAMGALLSIVGSGDMQMQDLANAFSTGILAIGKQYGATLNDVGAALATFGDNNIRGQVAATDLRMSIMDLTKQAGPGVRALESIGVASGQLGRDMQKGGLNAAVIDLRNHLNAAGITGVKVGSFLEDAFTKKSSAPLAVLLGEFDRFESKYPELEKGAGNFSNAWKATTEQFATRMSEIKAQGEAWAIQLGNILIPLLTKLMGKVVDVVHWFDQHKKAAQELGTVLKDFLIGGLILAGVALAGVAVEAALVAAPFALAALGIGILAKYLYGLYEHNAKFHAFVDRIAADVKQYLGDAIQWIEANGPRIWATIKDAFEKAERFAVTAFEDIRDVVHTVLTAVNGWLDDHRSQIDKIFSDVAKTVRGVADTFEAVFDLVVTIVGVAVKVIEDLWARFGSHLISHAVTALKILWDTFKGVFSGILQVVRGAFELIQGIANVFIGIFTGNWSKAWTGVEQIFGGTWNIIAGAFRVVWDLIVGILRQGINVVSTAIGLGMAVISAVWGLAWHLLETSFHELWTELEHLAVQGWNALYQLFFQWPPKLLAAIASVEGRVVTWGLNVMSGMLSGLVRGWNTVSNWYAGIPSAIWSKLQGAGSWLLNIGQAIMEGLLQGIENGWHDVTGFLGKVGGWIQNLKGPIEKDRQLLVPHGNAIMDGLNEGLLAGFSRVQSNLSGMAGQMAGKFNANLGVNVGQFGSAGSLAGAAMVAGGSTAGAGSVVNVTVNVAGSVRSDRDLAKVLQEEFQQLGAINGSARTYQDFHR